MGNVYISGQTLGDLDGSNVGSFDAFVAKYDAAGTLLWKRQLGTGGLDFANGVSTDGHGNVYISGSSSACLGGTNCFSDSAFVAKYDAAGNLQWTRNRTAPVDRVKTILARASQRTAKEMSQTGRHRHKLQLCHEIRSGREPAMVANWDASSSGGVSADDLGDVDITGYTSLTNDAYVRKYDAAGNLRRQAVGTRANDGGYGVSADGLGNVYISGVTLGSLDGMNAGSGDAFVAKYDAQGQLLVDAAVRTSASDNGSGASADGLGNAYFSGFTDGSLFASNAGLTDAFVGKFSEAISGDYNNNGVVDAAD